MFRDYPIYRTTLHNSLALTLAACFLSHCAQPQVKAPAAGSAKFSGSSQSQAEADAADVTNPRSAAATVDIDKLTAQLAALQAQKTDLTKRMSLVTVASADTSISNLQADQTNATHNSTSDGIGVAAGAAETAVAVALAVSSGDVGGMIINGIGAVSSASNTVSAGSALANDATAQKQHDATIQANAVTLAQAAALTKNFQTQLDQLNVQINQVQAQIDAYNADQLKAITGSSTLPKST